MHPNIFVGPAALDEQDITEDEPVAIEEAGLAPYGFSSKGRHICT
jgi:hypothetical protein